MAEWGRLGSRGNVVDRRGLAPVVGGISLTGFALLVLVNILSGGSPEDILSQLQSVPVGESVDTSEFQGEDEYEVFASTVLGSNNEMWRQKFADIGKEYTEPRLVLFRQATESSCGTATSQIGPHYCPLDETIYLDETFFEELTQRFGARGGDVAEAYVIAHEVAHHAQHQLGLLEGRVTNEDSIKAELQADCFAGMWAGTIKNREVFEPGEIEEAMDAAAAVGDDRIQEKVTGYVNPENFTHGSSEERRDWFSKGYKTGEISSCDTAS